jgi:hypothetical protein
MILKPQRHKDSKYIFFATSWLRGSIELPFVQVCDATEAKLIFCSWAHSKNQSKNTYC